MVIARERGVELGKGCDDRRIVKGELEVWNIEQRLILGCNISSPLGLSL